MQTELTPYEQFQLEKYGNILPEENFEEQDGLSVWEEQMEIIELYN